MKKIFLTVLVLSSVLMSNDYDRANSASAQALSDLDCEFQDCTPKQETKIVIKEKIVYVDKPVEKIVTKEKIVPVEKIVIQEKIVYRDKPVEKPVVKKESMQKPVVQKEIMQKPIVKKEIMQKPIVKKESMQKPVVKTQKAPIVIAKPKPVVEKVKKPAKKNQSQNVEYEEGDIFVLSESYANGKWEYDKNFIKSIKDNVYTDNNNLPFYSYKGNATVQIYVALKKKLKNFEAFVKYQHSTDNQKSFVIKIGKISFMVYTNGSISINGAKPFKATLETVNSFKVKSENGITYAYLNNYQIFKGKVRSSNLRGITVSMTNHYQYDSQLSNNDSDQLFDIGIIELIEEK